MDKITAWGKHVDICEFNRSDYYSDSEVTVVYHKYFLMILPKSKERELAFKISLSHGAEKVLDLWNSHLNSADKAKFIDSFKYLLNSISKKAKTKFNRNPSLKEMITDDQIGKIVNILVALNDVSLAQLYINIFYDKCTEMDYENLAILIKHFGFETLKPCLKELFFPFNKNNMSVNCRLIQVNIIN
jgi:hypothetical protein